MCVKHPSRPPATRHKAGRKPSAARAQHTQPCQTRIVRPDLVREVEDRRVEELSLNKVSLAEAHTQQQQNMHAEHATKPISTGHNHVIR